MKTKKAATNGISFEISVDSLTTGGSTEAGALPERPRRRLLMSTEPPKRKK